MWNYKGYVGQPEVDTEAGIIFGRVVGLRDVVTFQGKTVEEARKAFEESIDSYLAFCASRGEEPEKPFSGKFLIRIDPALHRALAIAANAGQMSLNAYAQKLLAVGLVADVQGATQEAAAHPAPARRPGRKSARGRRNKAG
jgi:predicted HicB family RNase H-like nuclease